MIERGMRIMIIANNKIYPSVVTDVNKVPPESTVYVVDDFYPEEVYTERLIDLLEGTRSDGKLLFLDKKDAYDYLMIIQLDCLFDYIQKSARLYTTDTSDTSQMTTSKLMFIDSVFEDAIMALKWFTISIETGAHFSVSDFSMVDMIKKMNTVYALTSILLDNFINCVVITPEAWSSVIKDDKAQLAEGRKAILGLEIMIHSGSLRFHFFEHGMVKGCVERLDRRLKRLVKDLSEHVIQPLDKDVKEDSSDDDYPDDYWTSQ